MAGFMFFQRYRLRWSFILLVVLAVAGLTIISLTTLYQSGIRSKIQALANSLEYRLDSAFSLGLKLDDFSGLEEVLSEYRTLNPDLAYVAMTRNDGVIFHTDPASVGMPGPPRAMSLMKMCCW